MQTRWVNATFWGPDPRLHPGIVYSQYARDVDVEPGAASKIRNPKISGSWRKFPRKSLQCPWVPGTLHPIAMLQLHPNHCKAQAVQPSENIPSIRYVRTCATTTTWRHNVQIAIFLGPQAGRNVVSKTTEAEVAVPAVTLKQWNPMRNTVLRRGNKSKFRDFFSHKHNWFQWNVGSFKFSDPNQRLIWCQWTVAFTRLHESEQVESFDLLFAMLWPEWSDFPSSLMRPCDPWCSVPPKGPHQPNHCPRRTSTSCTPAINIHIIHMHIQKSSKNSQANQRQSQYKRTYTCLYAYILQYMLCQTVKWISMWCQTSKESH